MERKPDGRRTRPEPLPLTLTGHANNDDPPQVRRASRYAVILTHVRAAAGDGGDQVCIGFRWFAAYLVFTVTSSRMLANWISRLA